MRQHETIAIIPARSGSKGVPKKNIALVGGKPLIAWTIEAALAAQHVDRVIVSTDSAEIATIARSFGAEVPFYRPAELARDDTPGTAPITHALQWLEDHEAYLPDSFVYLQPTSPLRTAADIDAALALAQRTGADAVVSGVSASQHPFWMKQLDAQGRVSPFLAGDIVALRRQDLPPVYALNGAIYMCRRSVFIARETWYTENTFMYIMPEDRSLDIDSGWDMYLADLILRAR